MLRNSLRISASREGRGEIIDGLVPGAYHKWFLHGRSGQPYGAKRRHPMEDRKLSIPGALVGALVGLGAEIAISELTGFDIVGGLLEIIGAGFGLIRIDKRIYESTVKLLGKMDIQPDDDYQQVLRRIDELTLDLPELRESFFRLMEAGLRAKSA